MAPKAHRGLLKGAQSYTCGPQKLSSVDFSSTLLLPCIPTSMQLHHLLRKALSKPPPFATPAPASTCLIFTFSNLLLRSAIKLVFSHKEQAQKTVQDLCLIYLSCREYIGDKPVTARNAATKSQHHQLQFPIHLFFLT